MNRPPETQRRATLIHFEANGPKKPNAFLEIREVGSIEVTCVNLVGGRQVVGRSPDLAISLPNVSVSRFHAEFLEDPYDRWWLHDLGSTNGTFVNGTRVKQRLLNAGDMIQVGDYLLRFRFPGGTKVERPLAVTEPPSSRRNRPPSTVRFRAVDASRLNALHLAGASDLSSDLLQIDSKTGRLECLCRYTVGEQFPGLSAWVLRLSKKTLPRVHFGPLQRSNALTSNPHKREQLEAVCATQEATLFEGPGPHVFKIEGLATFVAVTVETRPDGMDVLYVEFPEFAKSEDWRALLTLLAESYQQANEVWEMRDHVRMTAVVDRELEMAREIQAQYIPDRPQLIDGLEIAVGYEPCQWVGGDYVDSLRMPDGRILLVIADVCGKGIQASLVASSLHTLVHSLVDANTGLAQLVGRMNSYLYRFLPEYSFVTLVAVAVNPQTREVECVNAGHPPAFLASVGETVVSLQSHENAALGMADGEIVASKAVLRRGDHLLLYTDGVTEAEDPERRRFGEDRLAREFDRIVASLADAHLQTLGESLSKTLRMHRGSLMATDDTTFLIARLACDAPQADATTHHPDLGDSQFN